MTSRRRRRPLRCGRSSSSAASSTRPSASAGSTGHQREIEYHVTREGAGPGRHLAVVREIEPPSRGLAEAFLERRLGAGDRGPHAMPRRE